MMRGSDEESMQVSRGNSSELKFSGIPIGVCQSRALEGCPLVRISSLRSSWPSQTRSDNENFERTAAVFLGVGCVAVAYHPAAIIPSCDAALAYFLGRIQPELARGKRVIQITNHSALSAIAAATAGALSAVVNPRTQTARDLACRGVNASKSASRSHSWSSLEIHDTIDDERADLLLFCDIDCSDRDHLLRILGHFILSASCRNPPFAIIAWPVGKHQHSIEGTFLDALSSNFDLTLLDLPDLPSDAFRPLHDHHRSRLTSSKKRSFSDLSSVSGPLLFDSKVRAAKSRIFLRVDSPRSSSRRHHHGTSPLSSLNPSFLSGTATHQYTTTNSSTNTNANTNQRRSSTGPDIDDDTAAAFSFLRPRAISHDL